MNLQQPKPSDYDCNKRATERYMNHMIDRIKGKPFANEISPKYTIPDTGEIVDKIAQAVQNDIDDAKDVMNANIIAKSIIHDWEELNRLIPDGVKHAMQESFIQAVSQDKLSIEEATTNLEGALIEHDEGARLEAWDDFDMQQRRMKYRQ